MDKEDILGWIIVLGIIAIILILGFSGIDLTGAMIDLNDFFFERAGIIGVLISIFIISIFGTFSIVMPVPYTIAVITVLLTMPINPLIVALFTAMGASIGELSAWLLGRGTAELIDEHKYKNKIKGLDALTKKGYGSWLLYLFAATPLPDDILLFVLGINEFPVKKAVIASFLGKFTSMLTLILVIFFLKSNWIGHFILYLFGFDITNGGVETTGNTITSSITLAVTLVITLIAVAVDWEKIFKRRKKLKKEKD